MAILNTVIVVSSVIMFGNHLENTNKHDITITEINDHQKIDHHHMSKTQIVIEAAGIQLPLTETAG